MAPAKSSISLRSPIVFVDYPLALPTDTVVARRAVKNIHHTGPVRVIHPTSAFHTTVQVGTPTSTPPAPSTAMGRPDRTARIAGPVLGFVALTAFLIFFKFKCLPWYHRRKALQAQARKQQEDQRQRDSYVHHSFGIPQLEVCLRNSGVLDLQKAINSIGRACPTSLKSTLSFQSCPTPPEKASSDDQMIALSHQDSLRKFPPLVYTSSPRRNPFLTDIEDTFCNVWEDRDDEEVQEAPLTSTRNDSLGMQDVSTFTPSQALLDIARHIPLPLAYDDDTFAPIGVCNNKNTSITPAVAEGLDDVELASSTPTGVDLEDGNWPLKS